MSLVNQDCSEIVLAMNPKDVPMVDTNFWAWLESENKKGLKSYKVCEIIPTYLKNIFGIIVGTHKVNPEVLKTLKGIFNHFVFASLKRG